MDVRNRTNPIPDNFLRNSFPLFRKLDRQEVPQLFQEFIFLKQQFDNEVFINGVQAEIIDATQNRLVIALPNNPEGTYSIKVSVKGEVVEGLKIYYATPQAPPELAVLQVMPSSAYAGDLVTLIGQCFSTVVSENQVTINGVTAEVKRGDFQPTQKLSFPTPRKAVTLSV